MQIHPSNWPVENGMLFKIRPVLTALVGGDFFFNFCESVAMKGVLCFSFTKF